MAKKRGRRWVEPVGSTTFSVRASKLEVAWWRGVALREGVSLTRLVRRAVGDECRLLDAEWREKQ